MKILKSKLVEGGSEYHLENGWIVRDCDNVITILKSIASGPDEGEYEAALFWAEIEGVSCQYGNTKPVPQEVIEFAVDLELDSK